MIEKTREKFKLKFTPIFFLRKLLFVYYTRTVYDFFFIRLLLLSFFIQFVHKLKHKIFYSNKVE